MLVTWRFRIKLIKRKWGEVMRTNFKKWIKCAAVRAIKTVAQTAIASIAAAKVMGEVNWVMVGSASLLAGILSLLTSVAGIPEVKEENEEEVE